MVNKKESYTQGIYYNLLKDTGIEVDFSYQYTESYDLVRTIITYDNYLMPSLHQKFARPSLVNTYVEVEGGQTKLYGICSYLELIGAIEEYKNKKNFSGVFTGN